MPVTTVRFCDLASRRDPKGRLNICDSHQHSSIQCIFINKENIFFWKQRIFWQVNWISTFGFTFIKVNAQSSLFPLIFNFTVCCTCYSLLLIKNIFCSILVSGVRFLEGRSRAFRYSNYVFYFTTLFCLFYIQELHHFLLVQSLCR